MADNTTYDWWEIHYVDEKHVDPGSQVITFSCSTELSMKFILLINVKMQTIVIILTFINRINTTPECFKMGKKAFMSNLNIKLS